MKFLFDQNISYRILKLLPVQFQGSSHVKEARLINSDDKVIWNYAKKNSFVIVTQDSDFNDLNSLYGFPPKIIWIRTGNLPTETIVKVLLSHYDELKSFLSNENYGCFEIVKMKARPS